MEKTVEELMQEIAEKDKIIADHTAKKPYKTFATKEEYTDAIKGKVGLKGEEKSELELLRNEFNSMKLAQKQKEQKTHLKNFDEDMQDFIMSKITDETPIEEQVKSFEVKYKKYLKEDANVVKPKVETTENKKREGTIETSNGVNGFF